MPKTFTATSFNFVRPRFVNDPMQPRTQGVKAHPANLCEDTIFSGGSVTQSSDSRTDLIQGGLVNFTWTSFRCRKTCWWKGGVRGCNMIEELFEALLSPKYSRGLIWDDASISLSSADTLQHLVKFPCITLISSAMAFQVHLRSLRCVLVVFVFSGPKDMVHVKFSPSMHALLAQPFHQWPNLDDDDAFFLSVSGKL